MFLLRSGGQSVTDICMAVGFSSLGTFSRVFAEIVGEPPSSYRRRGPLPAAPSCFVMAWLRPGGN
jgi:AraC-like DNA-binding protein